MTERHAGVIAELTGILMNAARQCEADIAQADAPEAKKDAYDRLPGLARAVRLCLALEGRVQREGLRDAEAAAKAALAAQRQAAEARERAGRLEDIRRKALVAERVERAIEQAIDYHDETELEPHYEDLRTRLDDETFEAEFAHLPYEEVIRIVHRDLRLPEPVFDGQDAVRALVWTAQWAEARAANAAAAADPPPEPAQPPAPDARYASG